MAKKLKFVSVKPLTDGFKVPSGDAWVGDPCYLLGVDPFWGEFCNHIPHDNGSDKGFILAFNFDGKDESIFVTSTAYGDGCYGVRYHGDLVGDAGVDAGLLCIIPLPLAQALRKARKDNHYDCGVIASCDGGMVECDDGNFSAGGISVVTDGSDEEDEEEEYEDDYDEGDYDDEEEDGDLEDE